MRTVEFQIALIERRTREQVKKLKTSIKYFEGELKSKESEYQIWEHVQADALTTAFWVEKYLLLQLMRDTDDPTTEVCTGDPT